jgi:hypothetical protein
MRNHWKEPVPLYDSKGNFLEYITRGVGAKMASDGVAVAVREFKYGRDCVKCYREIGSTVPSQLGTKKFAQQDYGSASLLS